MIITAYNMFANVSDCWRLPTGAFETALREREQALALYGLQQRDKDDKDVSSGNGREHDAPSAGSGSSMGSNGTKRKRLSTSSTVDVDPAPLLRTVLGPHLKGHDLPGLFPFRLAAEGAQSDDRTHLSYLPMMAYAEVSLDFTSFLL